jgi:hypothetical protein
MITPPDPHIPELILAIAAKLRFIVKVRDPALGELGLLSDGNAERPLYLISSGGDRLTWSLEGAKGMDTYLFTRETHSVLASGSLGSDGAISYKGAAYRLRFRWSASAMVAETVAVTTPAA